MMTIERWNAMQIRVFKRYSRRHGAALTPELVSVLARRFALKHVRALAEGRRPSFGNGPADELNSRRLMLLSQGRDPLPPNPPSAPAGSRRAIDLSDIGLAVRRRPAEPSRTSELCVSADRAA